jgi:glycosyltransferase involved in cell wall biosynthesis
MTVLKDPRNAVLIYRQEAFSLGGKKIEGRQAAGASFLEGFIRYSGRKNFYVTSPSLDESKQFAETVTSMIGPTEKIVHVPFTAIHKAEEPGLIYKPDPLIGEQAWWRRRFGQRLFSVCGVAHTTASQAIMHGLVDVFNAPCQSWDAIICPSKAVRSMITTVFDAQAEYVASRFGGKPETPVQLPVIPLGINPADFEPTEARREKGNALREKIGAGEDDIVALFVGRLTHNQKLNPALTYMALEEASRRTGKKVHMVWCGWFTSEQNKALFSAAASSLAPSVSAHHVNGRSMTMRENVWHASDIFIALVDNIQETFGLVPVEAMAAGLPVVVTDWDGFRETVEQGETGFKVPTRMAPPGTGKAAAWRYECYSMGYQDYLQSTTQTIHLDVPAAADGLAALMADPELRRKMGEAGRAHVAAKYDWMQIIPAYQDLWEELAARREADAEIAEGNTVPRALDPQTLFAAYPTRIMKETDRIDWHPMPNVPGPLASFPASLGLSDAVQQIKTVKTVGSLLKQMPQENDQAWLHAARAVRWAANPRKPGKK